MTVFEVERNNRNDPLLEPTSARFESLQRFHPSLPLIEIEYVGMRVMSE